MNHAIIDLGSNSVRLSVYRCQNGEIHNVFSQKEIAGLAGFVVRGEQEPILEAEGIAKACEVLSRLKEIALKFAEPSNIHLFATASLRNIANREQAVSAIVESAALCPDILPGEEEAMLDFVGASHCVSCENGVLIDIGGASTELVLFHNFQPVELESLPIGCLSLYSEFIRDFLPSPRERRRIKKAVEARFNNLSWDSHIQCPLMVGVGGAVRATEKLARALFGAPAEQGCVDAGRADEILKRMKRKESDVYKTVGKTIPERVFTIFPGLVILRQAVARFGCEKIAVSKYGVREGYLLSRVLKS